MIDRTARDQMAELLGHFTAGQITKYQFEIDAYNILDNTNDAAIHKIFTAAWSLYRDLPTYKFDNKDKLPPEVRSRIARWILFLHSDLEYQWPKYGNWPLYIFCAFIVSVAALQNVDLSNFGKVYAFLLLISIFTLATILILKTIAGKNYSDSQQEGDLDIWPFICREDFEAASYQTRPSE